MTKTRSKDDQQQRHFEFQDEEQAGNTHAHQIRRQPRRNQNTGLSYRRPTRDYMKSVKWSGAMNKEIYLMYVKAKPSQLGYQKRQTFMG